MYCGNNRNSKELKNGKRIGSRYQCLKKGIGVGMGLPLDLDYLQEYIPIDARKIYCGKAPRLPEGYDILGTSHMCYTKGVGVGRTMKAKKSGKKKMKNKKGG
jgi:hypothetical protein